MRATSSLSPTTWVRGLVLVCPMPADGQPMSPDIGTVFRAVPADDQARRTLIALATRVEVAEKVEELGKACGPVHPRAHQEALRAIEEVRFADKLARVRARTLVVSAGDAYAPDHLLREQVTSRLPGARHVLLPDCGHYPPLERPQQTAALIGALLAGLG